MYKTIKFYLYILYIYFFNLLITERIGIFDKVEKSFQNQESLLINANDNESNAEIDINKASSKEVRNNVRRTLKSKFGMYNKYVLNSLFSVFIN